MVVVVKSAKLFYTSPIRSVHEAEACRKRVRTMLGLRSIELPRKASHHEHLWSMQVLATVYMLITIVTTTFMCAHIVSKNHMLVNQTRIADFLCLIRGILRSSYMPFPVRLAQDHILYTSHTWSSNKVKTLEPWDHYEAFVDGAMRNSWVQVWPQNRTQPTKTLELTEFAEHVEPAKPVKSMLHPECVKSSHTKAPEPWDFYEALINGTLKTAWII